MTKKKFYTLNSGFLLGTYFKAGAEVPFIEQQCIAMSHPNGGDLTDVKPSFKAAKSATQTESSKAAK